jgi:hypothetical protein
MYGETGSCQRQCSDHLEVLGDTSIALLRVDARILDPSIAARLDIANHGRASITRVTIGTRLMMDIIVVRVALVVVLVPGRSDVAIVRSVGAGVVRICR